MKKTLAHALRALAARLDPPAPITVNVSPLTSVDASSIASALNWQSRDQF